MLKKHDPFAALGTIIATTGFIRLVQAIGLEKSTQLIYDNAVLGALAVLVGAHVFVLDLKWGKYDFVPTNVRFVGGALFMAFPIIEFVVAYAPNGGGWLGLLSAVAWIFLLANLPVFVLSWGIVLFGRGLTCVDARLDFVCTQPGALTLHDQFCGASLLLRILQVFPLMVPVYLLTWAGYLGPEAGWLGLLPVFLLAKLFHIMPLAFLSEWAMVLERLQVRLFAWLMGRDYEWLHCRHS